MKYAAVAVALAGVAIADSTLDVKWETWSTTTEKKVDPTSTWAEWSSTTSTWVDPTSTWAEWSSTTSSWVDPTSTWAEWSSTTSKWVDPTESTWSDWDPKKTTTTTSAIEWESWTSSTTTTSSAGCTYTTEIATTKCAPGKPNQCWPAKVTSTYYADSCTWSDWDPKTTTSTTWADWVEPTTTSAVEWESWTSSTTSAKCSYVTEEVYTKCAPKKKDQCWEKTETKTVYPTDCTSTWAVWSSVKTPDAETTWVEWDSTTTVQSTVTETSTWAEWSSTPVVVTSVLTPEWSADGWFGPAWPTAKDGECVSNVVTSYGYPMWKPTPEAPTSTITSTWATWSATGTPKPDSGKGHAAIAPNGDKWSMTYTPYDSEGKCKAKEVVDSDIAKLAKLGFTSVRVYSTDCNTLEFVGDACEANSIKIILGVFISSSGTSGAASQVTDIIAWAKWEIVELIVIGNEAVFQGFCSADELAIFIKDCKDKFSSAGYTGSCTTTEPLGQWQTSGSQFCEVVDVVSANLYAYFNADTPAEKAGEFVQSQIEILAEICPGKDTYVMESGWPSMGECNGQACAGKDEQKTAIKGIQATSGAKVVFFSFEDEAWKAPGQFNVEQHWGCADVFGDDSDSTTTTWAAWTSTTSSSAMATSTGWSKW